MKEKILSIRTLLAVIFVGFILSFVFFSHFNSKSKIENSSTPLNANTTLPSEKEKINLPLPARLKIPDINVDAAVDYVGLTSDGSMGVPNGPDDVAWFNLGPHPGEVGSSVIDGHSGYKNNQPAVFDNLYKLKPGDKIYIEDAKGEIIAFAVRESRIYASKANPPEVFESNDLKAHLNLITCAGDWNAITKTHTDRLVIFADRVME